MYLTLTELLTNVLIIETCYAKMILQIKSSNLNRLTLFSLKQEIYEDIGENIFAMLHVHIHRAMR